MRMRPVGRLCWLLMLVALVLLGACRTGGGTRSTVTAVPGGDPRQGQAALVRYGCTACHVIPGVAGPDAHIGPSLAKMARRSFIGGVAANSTDNMVLWIQIHNC